MTKPRDYGSTKDIVTRLVDEAGGVKRAAFLLGRAVSRVYELCDPANGDQMSYDAVRKLTEFGGATAAAEDLAARAGGVFMLIARADDHISELSAKSAEEHGELIGALMRATGDGRIDEREARELLKECDQHLRAVVALRAKLVSLAAAKD